MFENIGAKLRALGKVLTFAGFVASGIAMIGIWITGGGMAGRGAFTIFLVGLAAGVGGALFAWTMGVYTYGFGQLIEDTQSLRHLSEDTQYCAESLRRMGEEMRRVQRGRAVEDGQE